MTGLKEDETSIERLTTSDFWDSCYKGRELTPFSDADWRNQTSIQLSRLIASLKLEGKYICEVGGGGAELVAYFAKRYPGSRFSIIDFSPLGCELARKRARCEDVDIDIYQEDVFTPPDSLVGTFDLVISHGVVEHFLDLSDVMRAKSQLVRSDGQLFTLIPNLASPIYSGLCRRWSKTVYEDHIPHNMSSFLDGHMKAGLKVVSQGYLGSVEFGILSMAMQGPEPKSQLDQWMYLWLTRFSKIVHLAEYKFRDFPTSHLLSPFIYAVSKKDL